MALFCVMFPGSFGDATRDPLAASTERVQKVGFPCRVAASQTPPVASAAM